MIDIWTYKYVCFNSLQVESKEFSGKELHKFLSEFQFLIGRVKSTGQHKQRTLIVLVSIPYRQSQKIDNERPVLAPVNGFNSLQVESKVCLIQYFTTFYKSFNSLQVESKELQVIQILQKFIISFNSLQVESKDEYFICNRKHFPGFNSLQVESKEGMAGYYPANSSVSIPYRQSQKKVKVACQLPVL